VIGYHYRHTQKNTTTLNNNAANSSDKGASLPTDFAVDGRWQTWHQPHEVEPYRDLRLDYGIVIQLVAKVLVIGDSRDTF
jgi:hypothetical protein